MLDGITDVRNFGAIARTCECAAVDAVIIPAREQRVGQRRRHEDLRRCIAYTPCLPRTQLERATLQYPQG